MRTAYSFNGNLYGPGRGYIAHWAVDELARRGWLDVAHNIYYEGNGTRPAWVRNHALVAKGAKWLQAAMQTLRVPVPVNFDSRFRDRWFDRLVALRLQPADVLLGWVGGSQASFRCARRLGMPVVLENPTSHFSCMQRIMREEWERWDLPGQPFANVIQERIAEEYAMAQTLIVPSAWAKGTCVAEGMSPERVACLPYGVDAGAYQPAATPPQRFRVLFSGEVGMRKGVLYLLRAWEKLNLPDAELVLLGPVRPEVERLAGNILARPDVVCAGFSYETLPWYQRSSVLVLPSLEDGYGLVVTEAMACGLPVIVSEHTGAKEAVRHGENGFVVPCRDVDAIATHIEQLYRDAALRTEMGRAARRDAEALSWSTYASGVADTLQATVEQHGAS